MSLRSLRRVSLKTAKRRLAMIVCLLIMVVSIIIGITIGWELRVRNFRNEDDLDNIFDGRTIMLVVYLVSVDIIGGSTTFGWFVNGDTRCNLTEPDPLGPNCSTVNIFFDQNLMLNPVDSDTTLSNGLPTAPVFTWDPQFDPDIRGNYPGFRTSLALFPSRSGVGSFQNYPFDVYRSAFVLYAQDAVTNATVGLLIDSDFAAGIAVGFTVVASPSITRVGSPPGFIAQTVVISRGVLVKSYAIIIVISIWLITLIFMVTSVISIIFGYAQRAELMVIPVATLFAVTQLRQTMPQAPAGYGAIIDYVGLLPCLAIMSICGAANIGALAFLNPTNERVTFVDRLCRYFGYRDADLETGINLKPSISEEVIVQREPTGTP